MTWSKSKWRTTIRTLRAGKALCNVGLRVCCGGPNLGAGNVVPSVSVNPRGSSGRGLLEVANIRRSVKVAAVAFRDGRATISARLQVRARLAGPVANAMSVATPQFVGNFTADYMLDIPLANGLENSLHGVCHQVVLGAGVGCKVARGATAASRGCTTGDRLLSIDNWGSNDLGASIRLTRRVANEVPSGNRELGLLKERASRLHVALASLLGVGDVQTARVIGTDASTLNRVGAGD